MTAPLVRRALEPVRRACARCGVRPPRHVLVVSIPRQTLFFFQRQNGRYALRKTFRCSTSKYGIGEQTGSNMTPRGLHRIAQKIGGGWPGGVVFKSRQVMGYVWRGLPSAPIAHRILWLEGLEAGFNRGGSVDSFRRYIYIHGTGNETTLGRPASHGCVHLAAHDLLPLYDLVAEGTLVWLSEG